MMVIVIMMANMVGCSLVHRGLGRGLETRLGGMLFPESYFKPSAHSSDEGTVGSDSMQLVSGL